MFERMCKNKAILEYQSNEMVYDALLKVLE